MNTKNKTRILATRRFPEAVETRLVADYDALLPDTEGNRDHADILANIDGCSAMFVAPGTLCNADLINALPDSVKIIATFSVGHDHIDIAAASQRGIIVTNTPDVLTEATADIGLLLMLGAARRANEGMTMIRENSWVGWNPKQLMGVGLTGKRVGIYGMGRIGRAFARRARALDMEVHYHNRQRLPEALEQGAIFHEDLDSLLTVSDVLSLHAPSTPKTRHSINAALIEKLPENAIIVNTARGDLVVDNDIIAACKTGRLAAIGFDVFDGEPNIHPGYRSLENAFLLPHLGSATTETRNAMGFRALDNLDAFFAGRECPDQLT